MRESRKRRAESDKTFYKKFVYMIEIDGIKYVFLNKGDIEIKKVNKKELTDDIDYLRQY